MQIITQNAPTINPQILTPHQLGQQDARDGFACVPESYYARRMAVVQYAAGYASVQASEQAAYILGLTFVPAEVA